MTEGVEGCFKESGLYPQGHCKADSQTGGQQDRGRETKCEAISAIRGSDDDNLVQGGGRGNGEDDRSKKYLGCIINRTYSFDMEVRERMELRTPHTFLIWKAW